MERKRNGGSDLSTSRASFPLIFIRPCKRDGEHVVRFVGRDRESAYTGIPTLSLSFFFFNSSGRINESASKSVVFLLARQYLYVSFLPFSLFGAGISAAVYYAKLLTLD